MLRNARWLRALLRPRRDVLPIYQPQRSGWAIAVRRMALLLAVMLGAVLYGLMVAVLPPTFLVGAAAPLGFAALLVVWALPDGERAPVGALSYTFVAFFACIVLWPNYLAMSFAGLPWMSMRRIIGLVLSGLLLVSLSTSKAFRAELAAVLRASPWTSRLLIAFFVIQFLASMLSISPGATIGRWVNFTCTSTAACFTAMWLFGPGKKPIEWFVDRMMPAVFVLMVIGVFEARAQHVLWLDHIPSFLHIDDAVMQSLVPHIRNWYRVVTTYTTPLAYGELLALVTPFVLFRLFNAKTWKFRLFLIAFDLFIFYSAVLSTARLSLVGFLAAHAISGLLWGLHRWRTARGDMVGISLTMLYPGLLVALALAVVFVPALSVRVLGSGAAQASNDARSEQWHLAVPVIARRPILGYGIGEGAGVINWRTIDGFLSIDLGFVAMAADIGVFGLFAYLGVIFLSIIGLVRSGLRSPPNLYSADFAVAVSLIVLITTRLVLAQVDNDSLFTILFGMALARMYLAKRDLPAAKPVGRAIPARA